MQALGGSIRTGNVEGLAQGDVLVDAIFEGTTDKVLETRGRVLLYRNQPIQAFYHSTSPGRTTTPHSCSRNTMAISLSAGPIKIAGRPAAMMPYSFDGTTIPLR